MDEKNTLTMEDLRKIIEEQVNAGLKPLKEKLGEVDNKLLGLQPKDIKVPEDKQEQFVELIKAVVNRDIVRAKQIAGDADATGGVLLPTEIASTVLELAPKYGVARADVFKYPMGTSSVDIPKIIAYPTDYWVGEKETKTASTNYDLFGKIQLRSLYHGVIVPVTDSMLENASVELAGLLQRVMATALGKGTDNVIFNGKAGTTLEGILQNTDVPVVTASGTTFSTITWEDLSDAIDSVDEAALRGAKFYINPSLVGYIRKFKDNNGRPLYDRGVETLFNYPIARTSALPSTDGAGNVFCVFGNLSQASVLGLRNNVKVDVADQATITVGGSSINLWQQGYKAFKLEEEADVKVVFPNAVCIVKTAAS